jgi:hypothetical protein
LTTLLFIVFPINKLLVGDYAGFGAQTIMYFMFPLTFMAIGWGFYDAYRIFFDARGLFETGPSRIPPASWVLAPNFNRSALGPSSPLPDDPSKDNWFQRLFRAAAEVPTSTMKAYSTVIGASGDLTSSVIGATKHLTTGVIGAADSVTVGLVKEGAKDATEIMSSGTHVAQEILTKTAGIAEAAIDGTAGAIREAGSAAEKTASLLGKLPQIAEKIGTGLSDPAVLMAKAKAGAALPQAGGALLNMSPSVSSSVLLFSVALIAFSGYAFYTLRKTVNKNTDDDDSPPDARAV